MTVQIDFVLCNDLSTKLECGETKELCIEYTGNMQTKPFVVLLLVVYDVS